MLRAGEMASGHCSLLGMRAVCSGHSTAAQCERHLRSLLRAFNGYIVAWIYIGLTVMDIGTAYAPVYWATVHRSLQLSAVCTAARYERNFAPPRPQICNLTFSRYCNGRRELFWCSSPRTKGTHAPVACPAQTLGNKQHVAPPAPQICNLICVRMLYRPAWVLLVR